jgi:sugar/nucleoside kinase (ribokinase family)
MSNRQLNVPIACGSGFVALDVVVDQTSGSESCFAGGTCGNVLVILSFLGWSSTPIARLAEDRAGRLVRADLKRWGVKQTSLGLEPTCPTPIVIEEIYRNKAGAAKHRYIWTCPDCGGYLPPYRPVRSRTVSGLSTLPNPAVFFFDRVSRGVVDLALHFASTGALIVFEPSASSDARQFKEALEVCHILKYSSQRVRAFAHLLGSNKALVEIETLGEEGLRYRTRLATGHSWKHLPSFPVEDVKDTAGCGDWFTAGLLSSVASNGFKGFSSTKLDSLQAALEFGQGLSAWNCGFLAARGGMYLMNRSAVLNAVDTIISGADIREQTRKTDKRNSRNQSAPFCPACAKPRQASRRMVAPHRMATKSA